MDDGEGRGEGQQEDENHDEGVGEVIDHDANDVGEGGHARRDDRGLRVEG